jgi:hypothetical protein
MHDPLIAESTIRPSDRYYEKKTNSIFIEPAETIKYDNEERIIRGEVKVTVDQFPNFLHDGWMASAYL